MLQSLARNHKTITWFLVTLFYLQLVAPLVSRANTLAYAPFHGSYDAGTRERTPEPGMPSKNTNVQKASAISVADIKVKKVNSPAHVKGVATTGPTQPEVQSFQSVNSNNLVDPFSGDFSYNIPLLDVGGYPVNLHYQSGITMDQEASWVGLGWNINPGAISRNMRGLPDDFKGVEKIEKTVYIKPNRTIGGVVGKGVEIFGGPVNIGNDVSVSVFHNTYKGWGLQTARNVSVGIGVGAKGSLSAGLSVANNTQNGTDISPSMGFQLGSKENTLQGSINIGTNYNTRTGIQNLQITGQMRAQVNATNNVRLADPGLGRFSTSISFSRPSYTPTISIPYNSQGWSFRLKGGTEGMGAFTYQHIQGYMSTQEVKAPVLSLPAYGYLFYEKANKNPNVLLDFNREKDVTWTDNSPNIAVPIYTYDTWSISGEGTGGMFRAYRNDIGYMYDHRMVTTSDNYNIGADIGFGDILKAGLDYQQIDAYTKNNAWLGDNDLVGVIPFRSADTTFENVYFKNPGEKTAADKVYQQALGGDNLMRVDLAAGNNNKVVTATSQLSLFKNGRATGKISFDANTLRKQRDKRSQVISYLNAREAAEVGLDKVIKNYGINSFPVSGCAGFTPIQRYDSVNRLEHHVSEISVLNADGRRYVYGVPVYNRQQVDVTMATDPGDNSTGLVGYTPGLENYPGNDKGKDGYVNREVLPAYSHSFLLSGILSGDYVDLTGDGITEDDMGDAVKFNYSEVYGLDDAYQWRAPYDLKKASYNEGLKTDSRDKKGSYSYGKREVWYLNSVESKTMIATFVLDADRKDGYGVIDENGGQGAQKLYKLKEINLYTKADFKKNGANARPIKTVHFEYSYELCRKNPGSVTDSGKLTLKKIWFSYNNNFKGKRNPYVFTYGGPNPDFTLKSADRWGNYKDGSANPGNPGQVLTNADYPYTLQPGTNNWTESQANNVAAPWTLNEVKLPSGGRLKVTYESDDYAYVQNKRAMQFFTIKGFGESETAAPKSKLYQSNGDYPVVFVKVTDPVNDKSEITRKYLDGVSQLYMKMAVDMPGDNWGRGYELVPCYADIEDYGVTADRQVIWIRVKAISAGKSPMAMAAIQFMRLNLPSKAYPFSEPGDKIDIRAAVNMVINVSSLVVNLLKEAGFDNKVRNSNKCNNVELDKSFVRLDNPIYKKFGGGLRVNKTEIFDNWGNMTAKTGKQQDSAVYGQTYTYTDTVLINGVETGISSGVASYEPMIGGDENPFHVPAKVYSEKVGAMAPTNYMYTEEPFAETFFPGPSVGYSKIRVQTIHRDKKSANGFDETEFYTTRDFPTVVEYTPIDNDSKKPYKTPISNPFFFSALTCVTLSQGFKIELNDMNGKPKSQSAYAQNDPANPISYTYNYYRLENDNAGQPKLSNTVAIADSANGKIDMNGIIGKDVEVMVDVREQTSTTSSANVEGNLDLIGWGPATIPIISIIPLFNGETNRYRAVSVLKIVNRYGILDSVIHFEKGSRVTTRNLVYDGETGDVLLSQTNNEFDDPLYNFSYPAHWAYDGMGAAYTNIGTILNDVHFRKGILFSSSNARMPANRYFKSGDELLVLGYDKRNGSDDHCAADYYLFDRSQGRAYKKIWAIDASRGKQQQNGIYFIDEWGVPYSCDSSDIRVIRSGKRNLAGITVGSITSLQTPIKVDNGIPRFIIDTATHVIAANAGRFKDMWAVDSTIFRKDTTVIATHRMVPIPITIPADDYYALQNYKGEGNNADNNVFPAVNDINMFEASAYDNGTGSWDREYRSFLRFNMNTIPQGALITAATLRLYGNQDAPDVNDNETNKSWIEHLNSGWVKEVINTATTDEAKRYAYYYYWDNPEPVDPDPNSKVLLPETPHGQEIVRNETIDITPMARNMLHDLYADGNAPVIRIRLDGAGDGKKLLSRMTYNSNLNCQTQTQTFARAEAAIPVNSCMPTIDINYFPPCAGGSQPYYLDTPPLGADDNTPGGGYYCNLSPVNTYVCRPNINDTAVNPYRLGLLGNWRMDRAYTYYGNRMQADPAVATDIRTDGVIKDFATYWTFNDNALTGASTDTSRWVWNSELARFNNKGYEIENHDPLDRYNSGQYGYNQTLPVAVAQNAKNREIAFDGFEDYGYTTDDCIKCVLNRHIDLGKDANLVDTVSHTGLYSRRVNGNEVGYATFNIGTPDEVKDAPELSMKEDSVPLVSTNIHGDGQGLTVTYGSFYDTGPNPGRNNWTSLGTGQVDFQSPQLGLCCTEDMNFRWRGYVQPRYTGTYTFYCTADDIMTAYITVNGTRIHLTDSSAVEVFEGHSYSQAYPTKTVLLQAGELYYIEVNGVQNHGNFQFQMQWESANQAREVMPPSQLYTEGTDIAAVKNRTIIRDTTWCVKFNNPTGTHLTHKRFSPIQGQKVVVSAWVKQDQPCISGGYYNAAVGLAFDNNTGTNYFNFTPTGNIIEGWQRIEDTLTIPKGATTMTMNLRATSGTPVFFDDIRVQPFNANMKSFVYNPVNLRLMAELDENNYATFYEYDDEGTLIRVKKETEKGIKTIRETRSALLKE
ncbi:hypothetical protein A4D02_35580 [Niastella koreensis]|uniref:PA14 domain protein n=2 Tax=Niastella koreensis TaxID=354356 RepID=G8TAM8_NIAKG|nr:PA14 domain-containing protein [Niastella koreensis]AEV99208.1 PA14 domain protein [Niastella koreensis GR20-10]OQP44219.1 hypothetical protein A4D02_35580 [Niastella koreensis]